MSGRYIPSQKIYGTKLQEALKREKILVVGAGGIGCELLKNLVLAGFEQIEIVCCF